MILSRGTSGDIFRVNIVSNRRSDVRSYVSPPVHIASDPLKHSVPSVILGGSGTDVVIVSNGDTSSIPISFDDLHAPLK